MKGRGDDGAILILVLVLVTVVGLASAALVQLGYASARSSAVHGEQLQRTYALDTGMRAAIESLRSSSSDPVCPALPQTILDVDAQGTATQLVSCRSGASFVLEVDLAPVRPNPHRTLRAEVSFAGTPRVATITAWCSAITPTTASTEEPPCPT